MSIIELIDRLKFVADRDPALEVVFIDDGHRCSITKFGRDESAEGVKYLILKGDWI